MLYLEHYLAFKECVMFQEIYQKDVSALVKLFETTLFAECINEYVIQIMKY